MIRAGAATTNITCPVGTSLGGYFEDRFSTGVHDELFARALVLENGAEKVAIVCCDIVRLGRPIVEKARALASKATGIPESSIMLSATHIHTGPDTVVRNVQLNHEYLEELPGRIAEAVIQANATLHPASLRLGEEQDRSIARIRRFRMKGGGEAFNPGFLNPNMIGPVGDIDPQVSLLRVDDESAEPMALLGNFSMHPDCIGGEVISGDFPAEICQILTGCYPSRPVSLYAQGACGNISHSDFFRPGPQKGFGKAHQIALTLAGKMVGASENSEPMQSEALRVITRTLQIPYHPRTPEIIERAKAIRREEKPHAFDRKQAEMIENYDRDGRIAEVEVQVIRVGDTAFVGVPAEYFVDWGLEIKHWSPFKQTFIVELANGWFGYVATLQAYYRGGYEVMPILSAQLVPEAGLRIADAAIEMLQEIAE